MQTFAFQIIALVPVEPQLAAVVEVASGEESSASG
jgi:hypothetical protein